MAVAMLVASVKIEECLRCCLRRTEDMRNVRPLSIKVHQDLSHLLPDSRYSQQGQPISEELHLQTDAWCGGEIYIEHELLAFWIDLSLCEAQDANILEGVVQGCYPVPWRRSAHKARVGDKLDVSRSSDARHLVIISSVVEDGDIHFPVVVLQSFSQRTLCCYREAMQATPASSTFWVVAVEASQAIAASGIARSCIFTIAGYIPSTVGEVRRTSC
mmetsp:Transcript_15283/g.33019  ORF Transcript_15283/g.33019 Transcript_15283/m.33019 type:complete len:216 (+) Transcript_15283:512-1159(+)